jgi:segregation and condensation protein B
MVERVLPEVSLTEMDDESQMSNVSDASDEALVANDDTARLEGIIESVIFAAGAPVALRRLVQVLDGPSSKEVVRAIGHLAKRYDRGRRGVRLVEVAGGYQFRTAPENADWVRELLKEKPARLGRATLETLAIIAYKQPVTRAEIEAIRGVDVEGALGSLLAKRLIKIEGRKETVGRPLLYVTTPEFLEVFGLKDLNDLPTLKELPASEADNSIAESSLASAADEAATDPDASAEAVESGGSKLAAGGGAVDSGREGAGEQPRGDGAGDEGGPESGPDYR